MIEGVEQSTKRVRLRPSTVCGCHPRSKHPMAQFSHVCPPCPPTPLGPRRSIGTIPGRASPHGIWSLSLVLITVFPLCFLFLPVFPFTVSLLALLAFPRSCPALRLGASGSPNCTKQWYVSVSPGTENPKANNILVKLRIKGIPAQRIITGGTLDSNFRNPRFLVWELAVRRGNFRRLCRSRLPNLSSASKLSGRGSVLMKIFEWSRIYRCFEDACVAPSKERAGPRFPLSRA